MSMVKPRITALMLAVAMLVFLLPSAMAALTSAIIVDDTGANINLTYDSGTASYADLSLTNRNAFVKVCADSAFDLSGNVAGIGYKVGDTYRDISILKTGIVSVDSNNCTLVDLDFSRAKALYPGLVSVGIASDIAFTSPDYIGVSSSNSWLVGSFNISSSKIGSDVQVTVTSAKDGSMNDITTDEDYIVIGVLNSSGDVYDSGLTSLGTSITLSDPGAPRYYSVNGIVFGGDFTSPYIDSISPARNAIDIPVLTEISFDILDDTDVNLTSINVSVEGVDFTANATITANSVSNISVWLNNSLFTFTNSQVVDVNVLAFDLAGNLLNDTYHFTTVAAEPPSSGGGGGGGGGTCQSEWVCSNWSNCINNLRTRECFDKYKCKVPKDKPITSMPCVCETEWSCTDWGHCNNGTQERFCQAVSICEEKPFYKPRESRNCESDDVLPYLGVESVKDGDITIYLKGVIDEEIVGTPGEDIILEAGLRAGKGHDLHNVIVSLDVPEHISIIEVEPSRFDVLHAEEERTITIVLSQEGGELAPFRVIIRAVADEASDSVSLLGRWREEVLVVTEEPAGWNYSWLLLLLLLIPVVFIVLSREIVFADEFGARELMRYGLVGKRHVYVLPSVHSKYRGLPRFSSLKFSSKRRALAESIRGKYDVPSEIADLLASTGVRKVSILTPIIVDSRLKEDFKQVRFVNPLVMKDVEKRRRAEILENGDKFTSEMGSELGILDRLLKKLPKVHHPGKVNTFKTESIKNDKTIDSLNIKESEELEENISPIDRKIKALRERLATLSRRNR